jgi:hypothetical protein
MTTDPKSTLLEEEEVVEVPDYSDVEYNYLCKLQKRFEI